MYIKKIYLKNFRNYSEAEIFLSEKLNVFYGNNAQGKTNILEGIFLGAIGKSFKPVSEKEMIKLGEKFSDIELEYFSGGRDMTTKMRLFTEKKKTVSVNNVALSRMSELVGKLTVVVFTPEELSLVKEGPGARRRFLDMAISQVRPRYMHLLSSYNKALEQKNKLLKNEKMKNSVNDTLPIWNEQLAQFGAKVILYRKSFADKIVKKAAEIHEEISGGTEKLTAKYHGSLQDTENMTEEEIKAALFEEMTRQAEREIFLSQAVVGPHRDDLVFFINGNNAKIYASQGQQRTIVLSLKLSQKEFFLEETEEEPVLLLDDITGELDLSRREYLFSKIKNSQVFITCTDTDRIENTEEARYFKIVNGEVIR